MARKAFTVRLNEETYEIVDRLTELTGSSKNEFIEGILHQSIPALTKMIDVLEHAKKYDRPAEHVAAALTDAANSMAKVRQDTDQAVSEMHSRLRS